MSVLAARYRQTSAAGDTFIPPLQIISDMGAGFSLSGEGWTHPYFGPGHGGSVGLAAPGRGTNVATWTVHVEAGSRYRVSTTWPPRPIGAPDAKYTIYDNEVPYGTYDINQKLAPDGGRVDGARWEDLVVFSPTSSTIKVRLTDDASGYVIADAVMVEKF